MSPESLHCLVDAAIEIAENRQRVIVELRKALEAGDDAKVIELARRVCALYQEKETERPN